ncbi:hypothetical protein M3S04_07745, partial [Xanthomonas sp. PPL139]|uniref:hypothetical protein n=1 Tax=Xanthomonas sp. PPL139 TaxID=2942341 RepID=UPI0033BB18F2
AHERGEHGHTLWEGLQSRLHAASGALPIRSSLLKGAAKRHISSILDKLATRTRLKAITLCIL